MEHGNGTTHPQPSPRRRLVAAGWIRRAPEPKQDRQARIAELHRLCAADYAGNATRRTQNHRDDAHLIAYAVEAATYR